MKYSLLLFSLLFLSSCLNPTPRRPISHHTKSFLKESVDRNKRINVLEETAIKQYIAQDSTSVYKVSSSGFWFTFLNKVDEESPHPKIGDEVVINYEISNLRNQVLYSFSELTNISYVIDKEDVELGLQNGLKLMKVGEEAVFLFTSHNAFGLIGDKDKIGMNQPLIYRVQLINIK